MKHTEDFVRGSYLSASRSFPFLFYVTMFLFVTITMINSSGMFDLMINNHTADTQMEGDPDRRLESQPLPSTIPLSDSVEQAPPEPNGYGPWSLSPFHPIAKMIAEPKTIDFNMEYDGYTRVHHLNVCEIRKGISGRSQPLFQEWQTLWHPRTNIPTDPKAMVDELSFAIVRDPLERLYSGYWNLCHNENQQGIHAQRRRQKQRKVCPGFPNAGAQHPTFREFLRLQYQSNWEVLDWHPHFRPQSRICNLSNNRVDLVLSLASDTIRRDLKTLWQIVGVSPELVQNELDGSRGLMAVPGVSSVGAAFDCETLQLALPLVNKDYQGPHQQFFPFPEWATKLLKQGCEAPMVSDYFSTTLYSSSMLH